jgi:hypothetical protein
LRNAVSLEINWFKTILNLLFLIIIKSIVSECDFENCLMAENLNISLNLVLLLKIIIVSNIV